MAGPASLPKAQSDIQLARNFYRRMGRPNQYIHCHDVYKKAARAGIIDEGIIRDESADGALRQSHLMRRRLALLHVIDFDKVSQFPGILPGKLVDDALMEEIDVFGRLTRLERRGAPKTDYLELLNNGKRPLATLIKIPDWSLTHDTEDRLGGFIVTDTPSIIREYSSVEDARLAMRLDFRVAENLWAPLAGFFGYQELSGDIFEQSYRINHPLTYRRVVSQMADPEYLAMIARTQIIAREASRLVSGSLGNYGLNAITSVRKLKHRGKQMEKLNRLLKEEHDGIPPGARPGFEEFLLDKIRGFDYGRFNDIVAVRTVLYHHRNQPIDDIVRAAGAAVEPGMENRPVGLERIGELLGAIRALPLKMAVKSVGDVLTSLPLMNPELLGEYVCAVEYKRKPNGYQGFHFDIRATGRGGSLIVPFEMQLRTDEWHYISERGGAAHYLYKGECDSELIETLGNGYHDLLYSGQNGRQHRNGPASCR